MAEDIKLEVGLDDNGNTVINATQIIRIDISKEAVNVLYKKAQSHENILEVIAVSRLSGEEIKRMVSGYLKDFKNGK